MRNELFPRGERCAALLSPFHGDSTAELASVVILLHFSFGCEIRGKRRAHGGPRPCIEASPNYRWVKLAKLFFDITVLKKLSHRHGGPYTPQETRFFMVVDQANIRVQLASPRVGLRTYAPIDIECMRSNDFSLPYELVLEPKSTEEDGHKMTIDPGVRNNALPPPNAPHR